MKFQDKISVVIAILGAIIFAAGSICCYVWLYKNFSAQNVIGAILASAIPGFISYSIIVAVIDFIKEEKPSKGTKK